MSCMRGPLPPVQYPNIKCLGNDFLEVSRAPGWDFGIFGEYWISRSRCNIWCILVQSTRTSRVAQKSFSVMVCMGLHWISLPYTELVQLIVQKNGNGRKQLETWSAKNLSNPQYFKNKRFRATQFFFWKVQRCPRGNGWKQSEIAPCGLDKFWPDHVSNCFRPFPTVSIFLNGPILFMEGWSSANPCKPWRWSFFVRPLKCA